MVKVIADDAEIYTWESKIGSLDEGMFMDVEITFDQFMFAMGIDDPANVNKIRTQCAKIKKEFEEELMEPISVQLQVKHAESGLEVIIASSIQ